MAKEEIKVLIKPSAERQITAIAIYIEEKSYPFTAEKFAGKLYAFAQSLSKIPLGHPVCRNELLAVRNFRCAVFNKVYIFIYKFTKNTVVVHQVIHGSRMK